MNSENILKLKEVCKKAVGLKISDSNDFILKNPLKLDAERLRLLVNQCHFNEVLPKKIPAWAGSKGLIAPPKVSIEQCSSEFTAKIKAEKLEGEFGLDLTGGLGVDSYFFSMKFKNFSHNEHNHDLSEIVAENFNSLNVKNVAFTQFAAEDYPFVRNFDFIYLDPARRNDKNQKLVRIEDCSPNLLEIKEKLLDKCKTLMVKYSPMLDIKASISLLKHINEVIIIAEKNEVKELVFILKNEICTDPIIYCKNSNSEGNIQEFNFKYTQEESQFSSFSEPEKYIFEPNASILKGGAFKSIASQFGVKKLAPNSHLYTSETQIVDFPGRMFEVELAVNYDKKLLNAAIPEKKANVSCRNFPYSPDQIKKELGWKDGGEKYVFLTENQKKKKLVLICNKIF